MKKFSPANLTSSELATLSGFLESNTSISLAGLHGYLASIGSGPFLVKPSEWLEDIFDEEFESIEKAQEIMELVFRMYNQILRELEGNSLVPLLSHNNRDVWPENVDRKALSLWCTQYMRGTMFYHDMWTDLEKNGDEEATMALKVSSFMLMLFADIDNRMLMDPEINTENKSVEEIEKDREQLLPIFPKIIQEFYFYWRHIEELMGEADEVFSHPKIGRNDPCFCGSGKKYKKCCLH